MKPIFDIPDAEYRLCYVIKFTISHSLIIIRMEKPGEFETENTLYLVFENVQYFEGPMIWKGANFYLGSKNECLNLITKIGKFKDFPIQAISKKFKLYKVNLENDLILKIVATFSFTTKNRPSII